MFYSRSVYREQRGSYSLIVATSLSSVTCTAQACLDMEGHLSVFLHSLFCWTFSSLNIELNNSRANNSSDLGTKEGSSRKERKKQVWSHFNCVALRSWLGGEHPGLSACFSLLAMPLLLFLYSPAALIQVPWRVLCSSVAKACAYFRARREHGATTLRVAEAQL